MRRPATARCSKGFTLVELAITLLVLGVLAAVAYPTFMDSVRKGRRSEAFASVAALQQAQERWRTNRANYTTTLSDLGLPSTSSTGLYTLSLEAPPAPATLATGYVVTAVAASGRSQDADGACRKLSVFVDRGTIQYGSCATCSVFSYAATDACWKP